MQICWRQGRGSTSAPFLQPFSSSSHAVQPIADNSNSHCLLLEALRLAKEEGEGGGGEEGEEEDGFRVRSSRRRRQSRWPLPWPPAVATPLHYSNHPRYLLAPHDATAIPNDNTRFESIVECCTMSHEVCQTVLDSPRAAAPTWAAIICAYVQNNDLDQALWIYECMQRSGISPNTYVLVSLLKAYGANLDLRQGMKLHQDATILGLASHVFVGSTLVSMYGKCGAVVDAENVFCELCSRNTTAWNAMLSAYINQRQRVKALLLYKQMEENEGVDLDWRTFVMAIQACSFSVEMDSECLEIGRAFHANVLRKELLCTNAFICTALAKMYGKRGAVHEAEHVLRIISQPDVALFNTLLSVYVDNGKAKEALQVYRGMQLQYQVSPDHLTFVKAFQACGMLAQCSQAHAMLLPLHIGQALHADACKQGFTFDVFVSSSLMSMYSKCQAVIDTEHIFNSLLHRNIVSWNAMLSSLTRNGESEMSLLLYRQMQDDGVGFDEFTLMYALQACGTLAEKSEDVVSTERRLSKQDYLKIGRALHADADSKGLASNDFVGNALVSMYGRCKSMVEAQCMFTTLSCSDVISWNSIIAAFADDDQGDKALQLYEQMQRAGVYPDRLTFVTLLYACATLPGALEKDDPKFGSRQLNARCLEIAKALYADMSSKDLAFDAFLCSSLVNVYAKCGSIPDAENIFCLPMLLYETVAWNAMLSAYIAQGHSRKALELYRAMREQRVAMDNITFVCILQACTAIGSLDSCRCINCDAVCAGYDNLLPVAATIIRAYGTCGTTVEIQVSFDEIPKPDILCWNACIAAYAGNGDLIASLFMFQKMILTACSSPDESTLSLVLSACSHAGVMYGIDCLDYIQRGHCILPDLQHYGIIVDLLGRTGDFKRLENVLGRRTAVPDDLTLWLCVLSACKRHGGHVKLARSAFSRVMTLHPKQDTAYILMSNIYLDAGMLAHAAQVDNLRRGLSVTPVCNTLT